MDARAGDNWLEAREMHEQDSKIVRTHQATAIHAQKGDRRAEATEGYMETSKGK